MACSNVRPVPSANTAPSSSCSVSAGLIITSVPSSFSHIFRGSPTQWAHPAAPSSALVLHDAEQINIPAHWIDKGTGAREYVAAIVQQSRTIYKSLVWDEFSGFPVKVPHKIINLVIRHTGGSWRDGKEILRDRSRLVCQRKKNGQLPAGAVGHGLVRPVVDRAAINPVHVDDPIPLDLQGSGFIQQRTAAGAGFTAAACR